MRNDINILFVKLWDKTFIKHDLELLDKNFNVRVIDLTKNMLSILYKIILNLFWSDIYFIWFSHIHSFFFVILSKIFKKKSIIVAGGYDCANIPEMQYGTFTSGLARFFSKFSFNHCDVVISVSKSSQRELLENTTPKKNVLIYNAVPPNKFIPGNVKKKNIVLTIGRINNNSIKIKGIDTLIETAKYLPEIPFYIVGPIEDNSIDDLKKKSPKNVHFLGEIENEELIKYYQIAKVYAQLSYHESFGVAIAEAMLCNCVPVVTKQYAIPEIVGNTGYYVPYADPIKTHFAISEALKIENNNKTRKRIKKFFHPLERERKIIQLIRHLY